MGVHCRIVRVVLVFVTSSLVINAGSSTCQNEEYTCNNGVCIKEIQHCDGNNDCGDFSDEDECTNEVCENLASTYTNLPCDMSTGNLYRNSITTDRLSFEFNAADKGGIVLIEADNVLPGPGVARFNIKTPSDERTAYIDTTFERTAPTLIYVGVPLLLHRGDEVTITMERSEDPKSLPWVERLVPPCDITGFVENRPCSLNSTCREWEITFTQPKIDLCHVHQVNNFILEWLSECLPFCLEDTLTDPDQGQLTFPRTNTDETTYSVEKCSLSDVPLASRACVGEFTMWEDPVLSDCLTDEMVTLENLAELYKNRKLGESDVLSVSDEVVANTRNTQLGRDVLKLAIALLEKIVAVENNSHKVTSNVLQIVDNIISNKKDNFRQNIADMEPSRILKAIQNQLTNFQMGDEQTNFTFAGFSVRAHTFHLDHLTFNSSLTFGALFSSPNKDTTEPLHSGETFLKTGEMSADETENVRCTVTLPATLVKKIKIGPNGTIPVTFVVYRPGRLFNNAPIINTLLEQVGSVILSARIEGHTIRDLENPVMLSFHTNYDECGASVNDTQQCVFWEFPSEGIRGRWSSTGCQMQNRSGNDDEGGLTECHCDHLTNFAVLIDVHGDIDSAVLDVLSMIGCVVSIIALIVTIITFLAVKKLRDRRAQQILLNLCFALLGLYLFFLLGINRIQTEIGCVIFGALIHFFCLSSLAWMAVEATNMYLLFVKVFDSGVSGFIWKAMLAGWGLPFVAVLLCAVITPQNYRSTYCFPRAGTPTFNFGVLFLVACILFYNVVIFVLVFYELFLKNAQVKSTCNSRKDVIRQAQNAVAISLLLGLTWIFGFLSLGGARFIFDLLFLIFCSLQGLFVFLLFCLRQEDARDAWKNCFRCKKKETTVASTSYTLATMTTE